MIFFKRKTSILVILMIVAISLFGCGGNDDSDAGDKATSDTAIADSSTSAALTTDDAVTTDAGVDDSKTDESNKDTEKKEPSSDSDSKKSSDKKKSTKKKSDKGSSEVKITISIDCLTLYKKDPDLAAKVSSKGIILGKKTLTLKKNSTVLDALKATGISFTGTEYISKINGLSEKDGGKLSGWMYMVNGEVPLKSCDKYTLSGGENVQWKYSCSNGSDI